MTKNKVLKIVRKEQLRKMESIKIQANLVLTPDTGSGPNYQANMYFPVDFPLTNAVGPNTSTFFNLTYPQYYPQSQETAPPILWADQRLPIKCMEGIKVYRSALSIKIWVEPIWVIGGDSWIPNALDPIAQEPYPYFVDNSGIPVQIGPTVECPPEERCLTGLVGLDIGTRGYFRILLLRAKKDVTDTTMELYMQALRPESQNGDFDMPVNNNICNVAYDKKFSTSAYAKGGFIKIPLKKKVQRQHLTYPANNSGVNVSTQVENRKLYLLFLQHHTPFNDWEGAQWHFLPKFHVGIVSYIKDE